MRDKLNYKHKIMSTEKISNEEKGNGVLADVSGSLTHIPLFQYNASVEAHKNTLDLLRIVQDDKKELKAELDAAYKEIDRLRGIINYR